MCIRDSCGLTGSILDWLASFVQDRTQQSRQQLDKLSIQQVAVVSSPVIVSSHARDLGVIIESTQSVRPRQCTLSDSELLSSAEAVAAALSRISPPGKG